MTAKLPEVSTLARAVSDASNAADDIDSAVGCIIDRAFKADIDTELYNAECRLRCALDTVRAFRAALKKSMVA